MEIKQLIEQGRAKMKFHVDENGDLIIETLEDKLIIPHNVATELLSNLQSKLFEKRKIKFSIKEIFK